MWGREREREREQTHIYFKELTHETVGLQSPKCAEQTSSWTPREEVTLLRDLRTHGGRIPSSPRTCVFSLKASD
jgi:hypothetical protein